MLDDEMKHQTRPKSRLAGARDRISRFDARGFSGYWILIVLVVAVLAGVLVFGVLPRLEARDALKKETQGLNVPSVSVIKPKARDGAQELVLPGNIQPFMDTPIYARTNGYLKRWHADIGAHVKGGQLLAEIDTPEIDDQLQQARADLATATANYQLSEKTAQRWQQLLNTDSVAKQEADEKMSDQQAKRAALDGARFNVSRLEKLQSFKKVHAPFAGVVTARNTDVGALIDAGSGGTGKELFHVAATDRLRVYVNVPQAYSRDAVPGTPAELTLGEFPDRRFAGKIVRNSNAIDAATRTMLTEVDLDNPKGELLPGAYAQVHIKLQSNRPALVVPINTLLFRPDGTQVAVVQNDQKVALIKVVIGRDFGTEVEIASGLDANAAVIVNPSDSLTAGTPVRVMKEAPKTEKSPAPATEKTEKKPG
jgi:RND family efflux transporter MFP subunit